MSFIKPDRKKVILFVVFALIAVAGYIQRAPLFESPPAQRPSPLGDVSFTLLSLLLAFPYHISLMLLSGTGILSLYGLSWLVVGGNIVYLYFLSCLSISGFNRYKRRFSKWHWIVIIGLPLFFAALYLVFLDIPSILIDDWLMLVAISLIGSLYLHLLFCLGFFIHYGIANRKASAA